MPIIELKNISKEYRNDTVVTPALKNIDLSVEEGEFLAIMGASGSGKTTLLHLIGCMDVPTGGTYRFDGKDMTAADEKQRAKIRGKEVAFVFQNFALIREDTVFENAEMPLIAQKVPRRERKRRVETALQAVGIADLARKRPEHISGGQKQRTAIARALACGARVLLADEPTGALDSAAGAEIMQLFSRLNAEGKTVIVITHDSRVAAYAHRQIIIQDGRIVQDETQE